MEEYRRKPRGRDKSMGELLTTQKVSSAACALCNAGRFQTWRWAGLEVCCECGHVRKSAGLDRGNSERIQEAYFDSAFALQTGPFIRFYDSLNVRRRLRE